MAEHRIREVEALVLDGAPQAGVIRGPAPLTGYRDGRLQYREWIENPSPKLQRLVNQWWGPNPLPMCSVRFPVRELRRCRWVSFEFGHPGDLPPEPCCYVVYIDGIVAYVGQTGDLRQRFIGHGFYMAARPHCEGPMFITPWGPLSATRIHFKRRVATRYGERFMVEARLIRRLQPVFNNRGTP